jgi:hypothetical protein
MVRDSITKGSNEPGEESVAPGMDARTSTRSSYPCSVGGTSLRFPTKALMTSLPTVWLPT